MKEKSDKKYLKKQRGTHNSKGYIPQWRYINTYRPNNIQITFLNLNYVQSETGTH